MNKWSDKECLTSMPHYLSTSLVDCDHTLLFQSRKSQKPPIYTLKEVCSSVKWISNNPKMQDPKAWKLIELRCCRYKNCVCSEFVSKDIEEPGPADEAKPHLTLFPRIADGREGGGGGGRSGQSSSKLNCTGEREPCVPCLISWVLILTLV